MVEAVDVVAIFGDLRTGRASIQKHLPELLWIGSISWSSQANANDGNGLTCASSTCGLFDERHVVLRGEKNKNYVGKLLSGILVRQ